MYWMIAEDEADIRRLVTTMSEVWGHTTIAFESGREAWKWLDEVEAGTVNKLPEFALMDIKMPGYRGDQVAQRIRETEALQHIPIVLMTAFVLSEDEMRRMKDEVGVDHIINKPLPDFMELKNTLESVIAAKQN